MQPSIPVSALIQINPGVISAGGTALDLIGLMLTSNTRPPIGQVLSFPSADEVSDYFGPSSDEAMRATNYFAGFDNKNVTPGSMLIAQYPLTAVAAFLRGGSVASLTLTQLQALTGTLQIVIDGYTRNAASFSLSSSTSFSSAAVLIQTALNLTAVVPATSTASTIAGAVLTVGGSITGTFAVGQTITGAGVTAGSIITSLGSGTGLAGTYNLSQSSTIGSPQTINAASTPCAVTYDSVSGGFVVTSGITGTPSTVGYATGTLATALKLTAAAGAILSQGAPTPTPATFMAGIIAQTQNWASFFTIFDPDSGSGNAIKLEFAAWTNGRNNRFVYVAWDPDTAPTLSNNAPTSMAAILNASDSSGTVPIYAADATLAAFVSGMIASIDFEETQGRITLAYKHQAGLTPNVVDETVGANLIANGYNFYGGYATANDDFRWFQPGSITGPFEWADSYVNQIWLNNQFQLALAVLLDQAKSVPYNNAGYGLIRAACNDPIIAGVNFGAIQPGVPLSQQQAALVRSAAGQDISGPLFAQGWFLQILVASAIARAARTSPPMAFYYMDGGSVQKINLTSTEIQ